MNISKDTAQDIALAYREVAAAEALLARVVDQISRRPIEDIRDAFGRPHNGLQLGVRDSNTSTTLFDVPWSVAKPIIEAHIVHHKTRIAILTAKAAEEIAAPEVPA
jgi:hypothetical protein